MTKVNEWAERALKFCPEKEECLSLKGKPIGMYHCGHCDEMILAGGDPTPYCPMIYHEAKEKK